MDSSSASSAPAKEWASRGLSISLALGVAAGFVLFGLDAPGPSLLIGGAAAVFLSAAVEQDVRHRRLPNLLTLPCLVLALVFHTVAPASLGAFGGIASLLGAALGFMLLFLPYALGLLGAGDVKIMMALGALIGGPMLLISFFWATVLGGMGGVLILAQRRGFGEMFSRWTASWWSTWASGRPTYLAPPASSAAAHGLPFALTLGFGHIAGLALGAPW